MSQVRCSGENGEQDLLQHSLLAGSCSNSFRSIKMLVTTISRHATFVCVIGVYEQLLDKRTTRWPRNMLPIRVIRNIAPLEWLHVTRLHSCVEIHFICAPGSLIVHLYFSVTVTRASRVASLFLKQTSFVTQLFFCILNSCFKILSGFIDLLSRLWADISI
jgi:hypothetical protein